MYLISVGVEEIGLHNVSIDERIQLSDFYLPLVEKAGCKTASGYLNTVLK